MTTLQIRVSGMNCAGCAQSIERRLQAMPGVQSVKVDLSAAMADISFDESQTNTDALVDTIKKLGFGVGLQ